LVEAWREDGKNIADPLPSSRCSMTWYSAHRALIRKKHTISLRIKRIRRYLSKYAKLYSSEISNVVSR
jgi:hypothetical protein